MQDHPQIKAFKEAATMLRAERYWDYGTKHERVEFLRAVGDVLREVCYHLDVNDFLPMEILDVGQESPVKPPAGRLLMTYLDRRIEQLIAAPDDARNTGAEGITAPNRAAGP